VKIVRSLSRTQQPYLMSHLGAIRCTRCAHLAGQAVPCCGCKWRHSYNLNGAVKVKNALQHRPVQHARSQMVTTAGLATVPNPAGFHK